MSCVISVKRSLTKVNGVTKVDVDLEKGEAVISFDDSETTVEALTKATAKAGYPSAVKQ